MLRLRTALALLLLFSTAASAQEDLETALSAVVRISGTLDGAPVRGSGFVVSLDRDEAMIATVSHVIAGVEKIEVTFAADLTKSFPAAGFMRMEAQNPGGPAVLQVRGPLPAGVTTLSFEVEKRPHLGEALFLLGFPRTAPRMTRRILAARSGTMLLIDQDIGEGYSGGPVLQGGKVVGIVSETDEQTTYAVSAIVAREALVGWGVKLGGQIDTSVTSTTIQAGPEPPVVNPCSRETLREYGIDFVRICSGTFTMGSADNDPLAHVTEKPAHQVTLSEFWIGKTEVTNAQYRRFQPKHQGKEDLPAVGVSWTAAKAACEYFGGRLPTEAEWEYAARAGRQTAWSFGDDEKMLFDYAWYDKNSDDTPHPVAMKLPNAWGLYDMHGNAWEWVADRYAPYDEEPQTEPVGPQKGLADVQPYVLRGGAFIFSPRVLRSAFRGTDGPGFRGRAIGFRCVRGRR